VNWPILKAATRTGKDRRGAAAIKLRQSDTSSGAPGVAFAPAEAEI
jgi:hypothetical protein